MTPPETPMLLETERLTMRRFTLDDLDEYYRLGSDEEVQRYTGGKPFATLEEAREVLLSAPLHDYDTYGYGRLACIDRASGRFIGWSGLKYLPDMEEVDIGYRFFKEHWGKGYATEAARAAMQHGRDVLGLQRIIAMVHPENAASVRVIEKIGLRWEKKIAIPDLGEWDLYA